MRHFGLLLVVIFICLITESPRALAAPVCDAVLRPNEVTTKSDYAVMQAYMSYNAEHEYDRLQNLDNQSRSADISYKVFSAEYDESRSREDFQERIRNRLAKESFNMNASESRALSRVYVTDKQVEGWVECIRHSGGGAVLIIASNPNPRSFPLRVTFLPPTGVGQSTMELSLDGGLIDGRRSLVQKFVGKSSRSYIVKPKQKSTEVVIAANIAGLSDDLTVDLKPRPKVKLENKQEETKTTLPVVEAFNPLFVGRTPHCNAAIVTNHQGHLNCVNVPIGFTIKSGPAAQQLLYLGVVGNVNAGAITTNERFRGGDTKEWGYTMREERKLPGSVPLYVVVGCGNDDGEVTTNSNHKNCQTNMIGWAYPK